MAGSGDQKQPVSFDVEAGRMHKRRMNTYRGCEGRMLDYCGYKYGLVFVCGKGYNRQEVTWKRKRQERRRRAESGHHRGLEAWQME